MSVTTVNPTDSRTSHTASILLLFLCSFAAVLPLLLRGPSCGQDFDFHLLSWLEAAHDWNLGLLHPHWLATANYGAGEPRFVFYPPASWMLGAFLGSVTSIFAGPSGWNLAPLLLTWLAIFGAAICVYLLALSLTAKQPALVAACLFIANPYLLFVAYERTAYGELLSTALIALLLLFSLRSRIPVIALALTIAALWLTNAPAAVMGCYTLALVTLLRMILDRKSSQPAWVALRSASACIWAIALAGFYLVPAVSQQRWVQISRAVGPGMRVEDSFLFAHTGEAYHDQVLHTASLIAVILFAIGLAAAIAAALRKTRRASLVIPASLLAILALLQFRFSASLWHLLPHLAFLQFPWRWLLVASVLCACLLALALQGTGSRAFAYQLAVALLITAGSIWYCSHIFYQSCDDEDAVSAQLADFHSESGVEGTDEYTPGKADNSETQQHLPRVRFLSEADADEPPDGAGENPEWIHPAPDPAGDATAAIWEPESKRVVIHARQPAYAVLRLMDYPAWKVLLNGRAVDNRPHRDDGLMTIPVSTGDSSISITWITTADVLWGRALSALAILFLFGSWLLQFRKRRGD